MTVQVRMALAENFATTVLRTQKPRPNFFATLTQSMSGIWKIKRLLDYTKPLAPPELSAKDAQWLYEKRETAGYLK